MGRKRSTRHVFEGRTASAIVLRPIVAFASLRDVDPARLLADLGVPERALDEPDFRIPDATHDRAWHEAADRARDPCFGLHVAEHLRIGAYDALDYALRFSASLRDAFDRIVHFHRLLCDTLVLTVEEDGPVARVRRILSTHGPHAEDSFFAYLVHCARALAKDDLRIHHVAFTHPAPADARPYAAFFRCPVRFGSAFAEVALDTRDLTRPVTVPESGLACILDRHMRDLLARLPKSDALMDRVRSAIGAALRDQVKPSLRTTARALHASPRTLQRRLRAHDTTHRDVVDGVRHELAAHLLRTGSLSRTEIAFLLGFADLGGLRRALKRWTPGSAA